jgi:hypothetical protein
LIRVPNRDRRKSGRVAKSRTQSTGSNAATDGCDVTDLTFISGFGTPKLENVTYDIEDLKESQGGESRAGNFKKTVRIRFHILIAGVTQLVE